MLVPFGTEKLGNIGINYLVFEDTDFSLLLTPLFENLKAVESLDGQTGSKYMFWVYSYFFDSEDKTIRVPISYDEPIYAS